MFPIFTKVLVHICVYVCRCIKRLLESWDPLKVLFVEESAKKAEEKKLKKKDRSETEGTYSATKLNSITTFLRSPTNRLFTMFLSYTVQAFDGVLLKLQAEEPLIHSLRPALVKLMMTLFGRFVKPVAVKEKKVQDVEFHLRYNQDNKDLLIGDAARQFLEERIKHNLRDSRIQDFYEAVRKYVEAVCSYLLKKLPFGDLLLKHAAIVDPAEQLTADVSDLTYFVNRFPCLLPSGAQTDHVAEQFAEYQILDLTGYIKERVDATCIAISLKEPSLKQLAHVMLGICTIPHSSAACERVFSCVRKNSTDQRASLSQDTMESLLVLKSQPEQRKWAAEELSTLKSGYALFQNKYKCIWLLSQCTN